jgi:hypothetical protein
MHPGQKLKPGARVVFEGQGTTIEGEVLERHFHGRRTIRLTAAGGVVEAIERIGHIPLPPYIKRADTPVDRERYQTVFAREAGSIAAPTAGLHFTPPLLESLRQLGLVLGCNDCRDRKLRLGSYCEPCPLNENGIGLPPLAAERPAAPIHRREQDDSIVLL